jgi:hypothetical protein
VDSRNGGTGKIEFTPSVVIIQGSLEFSGDAVERNQYPYAENNGNDA